METRVLRTVGNDRDACQQDPSVRSRPVKRNFGGSEERLPELRHRPGRAEDLDAALGGRIGHRLGRLLVQLRDVFDELLEAGRHRHIQPARRSVADPVGAGRRAARARTRPGATRSLGRGGTATPRLRGPESPRRECDERAAAACRRLGPRADRRPTADGFDPARISGDFAVPIRRWRKCLTSQPHPRSAF